MRLETAVQQIIKNTVIWIKANSASRPGWVATNFANFFIHECNLLVTTSEFKHWRDLAHLRKPRNLSFDFDCWGDLKHVNFIVNHEQPDYNLTRLNQFLADIVAEYWHNGTINNEEIGNIYQECTKTSTRSGSGLFATPIQNVTISECMNNNLNRLQKFKF